MPALGSHASLFPASYAQYNEAFLRDPGHFVEIPQFLPFY